MRRPRPSTFVWRSFVEVRFGGGFLLLGGSAAAASWLDRVEFDVLGSAEIARDG